MGLNFKKALGGVVGALNFPLVSGAAAGFGGSLLDMKAQRDANAANARMAEDQMGFQRYMSGTAHQREVEDLKAAGLNPILSANSGASSPPGAAAHLEPTIRDSSSKLMNSLNSAVSINQMLANIEKTSSETDLNRAMLPTKRYHGDTDEMKNKYILPMIERLFKFTGRLGNSAKDSYNYFKDNPGSFERGSKQYMIDLFDSGGK